MKRYIVRVEDKKESAPRPHELKAAERIAEIFESDLVFLRRAASKTPDLYVSRTKRRWELKSPKGGSKHTVQNNLRDTDGQSENIILDLTRAKLTDRQGISRAKEFMRNERSRIKRLKVLTKSGKLIDIK